MGKGAKQNQALDLRAKERERAPLDGSIVLEKGGGGRRKGELVD